MKTYQKDFPYNSTSNNDHTTTSNNDPTTTSYNDPTTASNNDPTTTSNKDLPMSVMISRKSNCSTIVSLCCVMLTVIAVFYSQAQNCYYF